MVKKTVITLLCVVIAIIGFTCYKYYSYKISLIPAPLQFMGLSAEKLFTDECKHDVEIIEYSSAQRFFEPSCRTMVVSSCKGSVDVFTSVSYPFGKTFSVAYEISKKGNEYLVKIISPSESVFRH